MAKKVVATLKKGGAKEHVKVIKMVKNAETNGYSFREEIVHQEKVKDFFAPEKKEEKK